MPYFPNQKFKLRRDLSSRWAEVNPVLDGGEPGVERDTGRMKIGNGTQPWLELPYFVPQDPTDASNDTLADHVNSQAPHPVYDDGPSLFLLYENAKV
jgi:hypothetical protein